ncbi:unnamed protein product [Peronospora farinosa]|uniref:Fe2OG dioxygenase domain-containing protein n=1 Tax=Peronospora farinosa TaxID=134698 RepID=A0AAV0T298_9STRA|nr:unnamed protein product [Peronospora farinosa]
MFEAEYWEDKWPFGGEGEPDDVPVPKGEVCVKISELVGLADENAGEYSFGGQADTLPVDPGLFVDSLGMISFPLVEEEAKKLIAKCEKSPYGHNMETRINEYVRKSWQLQPDQVETKNRSWEKGLDKLTEIIANRLGYEGIPLQCKLYKVLVYGEGGHFRSHRDTEKEDGMIATLVVQPPSIHEGGDLEVDRNGKVVQHHDFGKADGTAAYLPHFAVHYADAEHNLEEVTKGFRLAMVYSICLPATMHHLRKDPTWTVPDALSVAISQMENESFALLLSHHYTKKSIGDLGCAALKGIDRARFQALEVANSRVSDDKKLRFFIAKLSLKLDISLSDSSCWGRKQAFHWYTTSGEDLGRWKDEEGGKMLKFNFLNPGGETFYWLWDSFTRSEDIDFTGNEGPIKSTKYSRFAIFAWPAVRHEENMLNFTSAEHAIEDLASRKPVSAAALRTFLDAASSKFGWGVEDRGRRGAMASVRFCRSFLNLLVDVGDPELTKLFLSKYCPRLGKQNENASLIPAFIKIASTFSWDDVGEALLDILGTQSPYWGYGEKPGDSAVELLLRVAAGLNDGVPRQALLAKALKKIEKEKTILHSSTAAEVLWKHAICLGDSQSFDMVISKLDKMEPSELGPFGNVLVQHGSDFDPTSEQFALLSKIAAKRVEWLKGEIHKLDKLSKTFSWEMPYAGFSERKEITEFLRGPQQSMTLKGERSDQNFMNLRTAKELATTCNDERIRESSYVAKASVSEHEDAVVIITKTRKWYEDSQANLVRYAEEMANLSDVYKGSKVMIPTKRPRLE